MTGRYYALRRGEWMEALVIEADGADEAKKIAKTIPDEDWKPTRKHYGGDKITLGGVSLSDDTPAWARSDDGAGTTPQAARSAVRHAHRAREEYPPNAAGLRFQKSELYEIWRCRSRGHFRCYSASHIPLAEVIAEANKCDTTCTCWRHTIVMLADRIEPTKEES